MLPLLYLWDSEIMYLGPGLQTGKHSHNAIQLVVSLDGKTTLMINDIWQEGEIFVIPPNTIHQTSFFGRVAMLYLDAEHTRLQDFEIKNSVSTSTMEKLLDCFRKPLNSENAKSLYSSILSEIGLLDSEAEKPVDGRIKKCLDYIHANLSSEISMEILCAHAGISESSFTHMFSKEVGIPYRRFLLWKRLKAAVSYFLNNDTTLTEAAIGAGFTDQSHFTKTFKEVFGVKPSYIFSKKILLLSKMNRIKL